MHKCTPLPAVCLVGNFLGPSSSYLYNPGSDGVMASVCHCHLQAASERSCGAKHRMEKVTMDTSNIQSFSELATTLSHLKQNNNNIFSLFLTSVLFTCK